MPKVVIKFNLPEEEPDFIRAMKGSEAVSALWNIDNHIRNILKYEHSLDSKLRSELEEIRRMIPEEFLEL